MQLKLIHTCSFLSIAGMFVEFFEGKIVGVALAFSFFLPSTRTFSHISAEK